MRLKELTMNEIEYLRPEDLLRVYDYARSLKQIQSPPAPSAQAVSYMQVRTALAGCSDSLSEEIMRDREDRI